MQIMYPPNAIAAAAFYFAKKFTQTEIPRSPDGKEWWEQYGVKIEQLRGIVLRNRSDIDSVMVMVDIYNTLPQLQYQYKYTSSIVSPPETAKATPIHNGQTQNDVEMRGVNESKVAYQENGGSPKDEPEEGETKSSPISKQLSSQPESPKSSKRSSSPSRSGRSRSPRQRRGTVDSYRPPLQGRSYSHSQSRPRGREGQRPRNDYRYSETVERRRYNSPGRKRYSDYEVDTDRREKRRRESEEMSEGEVRPHSRDTPDL